MSISYSGLTNYGKSTLPSVSGGLGSMVIQKDPPKSIHTRRIDKVGESHSLVQTVQESGDRVCEMINEYPRGVNPMVKVSYSNAGNNGGQRVGGSGVSAIHHSNAYLPNNLGSAGFNFRPPLRSQENLLPLSRMPRTWTYALTNKEFPDFSKKLKCEADKRNTKRVVLKGNVRPTKTFQIERPAVEPFEVKYVIQNPVKVAANSGHRARDLTTQNVQKPSGGIINEEDVMHYTMNSQKTGNYNKQSQHTKLDTDRYIHDMLEGDISTKKSSNINVTPIEDTVGINIKTKNNINIDYHTNKIGTKAEEYLHNDISLEKVLPSHTAITNIHKDIYKNPIINNDVELSRNIPSGYMTTNIASIKQSFDNNSREVNLAPSLIKGGYVMDGFHPSNNREELTPKLNNNKLSVLQKAANQLENRYTPHPMELEVS